MLPFACITFLRRICNTTGKLFDSVIPDVQYSQVQQLRMVDGLAMAVAHGTYAVLNTLIGLL